VFEALGRFLVGLPVDVADAGGALQLHVAVGSKVILRRDKPKTWKKRYKTFLVRNLRKLIIS
jgi:hypothetical protein